MPVNAEYWEPGNEGGNGKTWEGNNASDDLRCGGSQGENEVPRAGDSGYQLHDGTVCPCQDVPAILSSHSSP